jgi:hypothetical protein
MTLAGGLNQKPLLIAAMVVTIAPPFQSKKIEPF